MTSAVLRALQYLVIGNAVLLIVQTVRVIAVYSAVYSLTENRARRQLPLHVWLIASSYLIYLLGTTYFLALAGQQNAGARSVVYGIAGLIGQYALWNVLSYERRQYSKVTNFQVDGDEDDVEAG